MLRYQLLHPEILQALAAASHGCTVLIGSRIATDRAIRVLRRRQHASTCVDDSNRRPTNIRELTVNHRCPNSLNSEAGCYGF